MAQNEKRTLSSIGFPRPAKAVPTYGMAETKKPALQCRTGFS